MSGPGDGATTSRDRELMQRAIAAGADARWVASPNPWVGAILVTADGELISGATRAPGQAHAEVCLLYTSPSPRDRTRSRMPSSA